MSFDLFLLVHGWYSKKNKNQASILKQLHDNINILDILECFSTLFLTLHKLLIIIEGIDGGKIFLQILRKGAKKCTQLFRGIVPKALTLPSQPSSGDNKNRQFFSFFYNYFIRTYTHSRGDNTEKKVFQVMLNIF